MTDRYTESSGEIRQVPIHLIKPSPENDKLYRPIDPDDPEVEALADSIDEFGLREPLVLTLDYYVLSGHRRLAACRLLDLDEIPCRFEPIKRGDGPEPLTEDFVRLLREYNRQRVKSFDEVAREEAASMNPESSYMELIEHRERKSQVEVVTLTITGTKKRARITSAKQLFLAAIDAVLNRLRRYWPLTDRQIHYNMLNEPPLIHAAKPDSRYRNDQRSYKSLCELLTRARLAGIIPFEAISDETRPVVEWQTWENAAPFLRGQLNELFKGYRRNLQQSQPNHIEIIGEKNTIENILRPVAARYNIPYTIGRGYSSLPPRKQLADRFARSGKEKLILLVLSDFDPEGEDIAHSFARSMRDDFGIKRIVPVKVALTADQVGVLGLPPNRLKEKSSRAAKFKQEHGSDTYELEALQPQQLQKYLTETIDRVMDLAAFNRELDAKKQDAAQLAGLRQRVSRSIANVVGQK